MRVLTTKGEIAKELIDQLPELVDAPYELSQAINTIYEKGPVIGLKIQSDWNEEKGTQYRFSYHQLKVMSQLNFNTKSSK